MSEIGTLGTIFIEPENTFIDLKRKPRFIIAGIIMALLVFAFTFGTHVKDRRGRHAELYLRPD